MTQKIASEVNDEEQAALINDIVGLLVAAGYFRARIRGLSPFDKIVGGLVWCLEVSSIDVDVDLFYDADALSIGQKIAVTEKIVRVLDRIKCPQRIHPHQIQGLDAAAIYPVVQWLVKKAVETRKERKEATLARGRYEFNKNLRPLVPELPEGMKNAAEEDYLFVTKRLNAVADLYAPKRTFRRKTPLDPDADEETRVRSTLLEFGERPSVLGGGVEKGGKSGDASSGKKESVGVGAEAAATAKLLNESFRRAARPETVKLALDSSQLSSLQKAAAEYGSSSQTAPSVVVTPARLRAKISDTEKAISAAVEKRAQLKARMSELKQEYKALEQNTSKIDEQLEEVVAVVEAPENRAVLVKLDALLAEQDLLKQREEELRKLAKEESSRLTAEIAVYKTKGSGAGEGAAADDEEAAALAEDIAIVKSRVDASRLDLAGVNKRLAELSRRHDAVPLRAELVQYQRRFVELYDEIASKHRETKQYYTLYNSLEDQKAYLDRAAALMNSVVETFPQACIHGTDAAKDEFVSQLDGILAGIRTSQARLEERKSELESKLSLLREERRRLGDAHRTYLKTVKLFQEECKKNETLIAALTQREVPE